MYKFKTDDKEFVGNCSDVDIDNDAQEEENEVKGIHEPFEDMDCFQVSLLILFLFVINFVFVSNIYIFSRCPKIARMCRIQTER